MANKIAGQIPVKEPQWLKEFKAFIMRGNVIDLAVGVVIGAAFTAIVTSMVEDLFNPILGLLMGGMDFSNLFVVISGERKATLAATRDGGAAVLAVGKFWMVKVLSKLQASKAVQDAKAPPPTPTEALLAEIRDELRARKV
ncbi:MAG: large conductance mechanosensitive channel protein MscL [Acetobacteraceae bacterium]|nr:large conductance mechanosensitive channel protein MscL [Acetobacteraceae bacterium]